MSFQAFFAAAMACAMGSASAAEKRPKAGPADAIRVDVKLVLVPVTVTGPSGAPFSGLPREAFRLFEDGVEQELKYFSLANTPVSLGVVFDASRSMEGKLDQSRAAVAQFFRTAMPGDEYFLVEFNDAPTVLCNFTSDTRQIEKMLWGIQPRSWTALFDAVYVAVRRLREASNSRKALLILSDGGDNYSRYTEREMKGVIREGDACIYSIGISGGGLLRRHLSLLRSLSEETGGRFCPVRTLTDLPEAIAKISAAIRNQYLLGYLTNNSKNNGLYRKVEVRLNPGPGLPSLRASWRTGYYAPAEP